jgi:hypothetical protein
VLLKREKKLKVKERTKLAELLALNAKLARSYILKEDFTLFFECRDIDSAVQFLDGWIKRAKESQLQPFLHLVQQLQRWRFNLLNYFITPVSNGLAEAINNQINVIKRTAYGFRDVEFFMLKILQRCGALPPLHQVLEPLGMTIAELDVPALIVAGGTVGRCTVVAIGIIEMGARIELVLHHVDGAGCIDDVAHLDGARGQHLAWLRVGSIGPRRADDAGARGAVARAEERTPPRRPRLLPGREITAYFGNHYAILLPSQLGDHHLGSS